MPFLFGPIVPVELVTTARRRRHYFVRIAYALAFLLVLWATYEAHFAWHRMRGALSIQEMAEFADTFFQSFSWTQLLALLVLTPAYVAPALADEKDRRTLEHLLTTDLRDREIVIGKLTVRLGHLLLYMLSGLPILSLASWFGGISYELLAQAYILTVLSVFALACVSMLASVYAKRVRDAVMVTYLLAILWLAAPPMFWGMVILEYGLVGSAWDVLNSGPLYANPIWMWAMIVDQATGGGGPPGWVVGSWVHLVRAAVAFSILGVLCLAVSVWRVRRVYLRQVYGSERPKRAGREFARPPLVARALAAAGLHRPSRAVQALVRPPLGERPMLWKELFAPERFRTGRFVRILMGLVGVGLLVWCGWYFLEAVLWPHGQRYLGRGPSSYDALKEEMNVFLRVAGTSMGMLGLLLVAVQAATSVASERERQTWDGLITTPLEPREIIQGKVLGALWAGRWLLALLSIFWLLGVLAQAIHPLAPLAMFVELVAYAFFLAAVGVRLSLAMRRSGYALATVLGIAIFLGGGYLMCCMPVMMRGSEGGPWIAGAAFPFVVGMSGFSEENLEFWLFSDNQFRGEITGFVFAAALALAGYVGVGLGIVSEAISSFDRIVGRPALPLWDSRWPETMQPLGAKAPPGAPAEGPDPRVPAAPPKT